MYWLAAQLHVKKLDDWYKVSIDHIQHLIPMHTLKSTEQLIAALTDIYPGNLLIIMQYNELFSCAMNSYIYQTHLYRPLLEY